MKDWKSNPNFKRNITIAAVLVFVGAAAWLNWSYNKQWGAGNAAMAEKEDQMTAAVSEAENAENSTLTASVSNYFSQARLTRQQSRDQALSLLETAASAETASQETIDAAMNDITAMANWSLVESKIENELLAKDFSDCVVYLAQDSCTVAVPAPAEGLSQESVARITDAVLTNTELTAAQINVIQVMDY